MNSYSFLFIILIIMLNISNAQRLSDGCTTITVGRMASEDGSVMTSHTCDSHEGHTWINIIPSKNHEENAKCAIYNKTEHWISPDPEKVPDKQLMGYIPQVAHTYGYIYGFYGTMNEHQLAIGESTFGGRKEQIGRAHV